MFVIPPPSIYFFIFDIPSPSQSTAAVLRMCVISTILNFRRNVFYFFQILNLCRNVSILNCVCRNVSSDVFSEERFDCLG